MSVVRYGKQPSLPPVRPCIRLTRVDREFLPAALEILQTPPSPVRMWLILLICALVTVTIAWSFVGRIDIIAAAQGKIQSIERVKLVQSVETGKLREVLVENGKHVKEGDVVVELDDSEARAEEGRFGSSGRLFPSRIVAPIGGDWSGGNAGLLGSRNRLANRHSVQYPGA